MSAILDKLLVAISEIEPENQLVTYGLLYQRFISNLTRAYTDFWQAYKTVIPHNRHRAVGKERGLTNHIERSNNTFRQRVSRLVRESLSFSKKLNNHIGAIWYFIHGYNAELEGI